MSGITLSKIMFSDTKKDLEGVIQKMSKDEIDLLFQADRFFHLFVTKILKQEDGINKDLILQKVSQLPENFSYQKTEGIYNKCIVALHPSRNLAIDFMTDMLARIKAQKFCNLAIKIDQCQHSLNEIRQSNFPTIKNPQQFDGIREAIKQNSPEVIELLVHSEKLNLKELGPVIHAAVKENRLECVKKLIELGADMNIKDEDGETALSLALQDSSCEKIAQYLIDHDAVDDLGFRLSKTDIFN